jgi:hypothetical protein
LKTNNLIRYLETIRRFLLETFQRCLTASNEISFLAGAFLRKIQRSDGGTGINWLVNSIKELSDVNIILLNQEKLLFEGSLLTGYEVEKKPKKIKVKINENFFQLIKKHEATYVETDISNRTKVIRY